VAAALAVLDVHFVMAPRQGRGTRLAKQPVVLLASLAEQEEARLRLGIIPLLLRHPDWAPLVPVAVQRLSPRKRELLKLYYTAAMLLQQKYAALLESFLGPSAPLTDWYSAELGIPTRGDPEARLRVLARKQREQSGLALNWLGTYEHAADRFVRHLRFTEHR
jgi:hypothetical protein